jgi:hypothetical protein
VTDDEALLAITDRMIDLERALRALVAALDAEAELADQRFSAIWPYLSDARELLDPEAAR